MIRLKVLLFTIFLTTNLASEAFDFDSILFQPIRNDFQTSLSATYLESGSQKLYKNTIQDEDNIVAKETQLQVQYGLTDMFTIGSNIAYLISSEFNSSAATASKTSKGIKDPSLYLLFRAFNQQNAIFDFSLGYQLGVSPSDTASSDGQEDGQAGKGGDVLNIGLRYGFKLKSFALYFSSGTQYSYGTKTEEKKTGEITRTKSAIAIPFSLNLQQYLTRAISLTLGFNYTYLSTLDGDLNGVSFQTKADPLASIDAGLRICITPEKLYTTLTYHHQFIQSQEYTLQSTTYDIESGPNKSLTFQFNYRL